MDRYRYNTYAVGKVVADINNNCTLMEALKNEDYDRAVYILQLVSSYIGLPIEIAVDDSINTSTVDTGKYFRQSMAFSFKANPEVSLRYKFYLPPDVYKRLFDSDFLTKVEAMEGGFKL